MAQPSFFDVDERLARLSGLGDQLEAFSRAVDFELFRPELEAALAYSDGRRGGRPPFDPVMMFKILVIQTINTLSDERTEYLINDRLSFMRFLGLGLSDRVPDAKTIWLFRERLTKAGAITPLFERFDRMLRDDGYIPMSGQIVDASLVAAPRQRNTKAEKADIKTGKIPEAWKSVIRSRVEHVFADQKSRMGLFIRTVGIQRAEMKIGMANLVYNIRRFIFLERISAT